ncbi:nuclear transport factor 2 family protein [Bradyrhizobium sp. 6(2017)]|uniref:nuclear transport factor 2 family protein n=1 Tax=Bradyrhizobium sp. 6(2017) TaxID=1197460 RepID=UPI0013E17CA0|nr:hypothetical protein [Bradyrhizobium sp. 6(2017)]QIG97670.1 hypothetical protein G6P99_38425 [Bradyrhizobium sp. 6(2017)]
MWTIYDDPDRGRKVSMAELASQRRGRADAVLRRIARTGIASLTLGAESVANTAEHERVARTADESNFQIVMDAFRRWSGSEGSLFDLMADGAEIEIPGTAAHCGVFNKSVFNADIAIPFIARFSVAPIPSVRRIWADGDDVAVQAQAVGTRRDGKPYANNYVFILKLHEGRIARATLFLDMVAFNDVWNHVEPSTSKRRVE